MYLYELYPCIFSTQNLNIVDAYVCTYDLYIIFIGYCKFNFLRFMKRVNYLSNNGKTI